MKYYVDLDYGCTIVEAKRQRSAEAWARRYFGERNFRGVRVATESDVENVRAMCGAIHQI